MGKIYFINERGSALVTTLLIMAVLSLIGTAATMTSSIEINIAGNQKTSKEAFYVAEAGIQEAVYRLSLFDDNTKAPPSGSMIVVNGLANDNAYISIDPNGLLVDSADNDGNGVVDDVSDLNYNGTYDNRDWQTKILLVTSETSCPTDIATTIYTPTIQPSGSWLEYSSSNVDGTELIIEFKRDKNDMDGDGNTQEIVFYNGNLANPYNVDTATVHASGQPVVVITSTGKAVEARKTVEAEATFQPLSIKSEAAVMVDMAPDLSGSALISGFNHEVSTTAADNAETTILTFNSNTIDNHGGLELIPPGPPSFDTDTILVGSEESGTERKIPYGSKLESSGHKTGVWSTDDSIMPVGAGMAVFGGDSSAPWKDESPTNTWLTLAQLLGVSGSVKDHILGGANVTEFHRGVSGVLQAAPQGIVYIDNAGKGDLKITSVTPEWKNGWGLTYVTGDVSFQNLYFKGLIYVEGDARITGSFWILGTMVIKGSVDGDFSAGNGTFLYGRDALDHFTNKGMDFVILSWREV